MKETNFKKQNFKNLSKLFYALSNTFYVIRKKKVPKSMQTKKKNHDIYISPGFLLFKKHCKLNNIFNVKKEWFYLKKEDKIRYERLSKKYK